MSKIHSHTTYTGARTRKTYVVASTFMVGVLVVASVLSGRLGGGGLSLRQVHAERLHVASSRARARPRPIPPGYYGINPGVAFSGPPSSWRAAAAQIARLGVGTVRRDAFWSAVEPFAPIHGVHRYRWRSTDQLVTALAQNHLRWYPIVDYATTWAGVSGWESPPQAARVGDYAAFAGALARRYGARGGFWRKHPRLPKMSVENYEIWNEPNFTHFWPDQSYAPQRLGAMYLEAQARIKASDPSGRTVLGGLSSEEQTGCVTRLLEAYPRLGARLEAVGFHPYGGGPSGGLQITFARIGTLRSVLHRLVPARSIPIEITETGWAVPWTPEAWRSERLQALATELPRSNCDVTRFIVYDWESTDVGPSPEDYFGIAGPGGAPTASAQAFSAGIAAARASAARSSAPTLQIC
jgi:hypothetical protein